MHSPDGHLHHLNLWFFQSNFIFGPEKPNLPRGPRALRCFPSIQLVRCCTWWLEITNNLIRVLFSRKDKGIRIFNIRVSSGYCMRRGVSFFVLESMHLRICGVDSANTHAYVHSYQCVKGHLECAFLARAPVRT